MPSVRLWRSAGGATAATPRGSSHWCVQIFKNDPTHNPPVYRPARIVGRVWFVPQHLSEYTTLASVPMNSEP
ncbi:hypothetical protein D3C87_1633930 [compost metagenome]